MASGGPEIITDVVAARPSLTIDEKSREPHLVPVGRRLSIASTPSDEDDRYPAPNEEERKTLRLVPAKLPLVSYSLCLVEFAERASYYGAKTMFSNFIQFPLPKGGNGAGAPPRGTQKTAGALGWGLQASSGLTLLFAFLAYVLPIFGGWWADTKIGRYRAIVYGVLICGVAHIVQIIGVIPSVLQKGPSNAAPPFMIGFFMLAVGAGIFKPNIAPTIIDQMGYQKQYTKVLKSGEKVIVDPEATISRTMLVFYGFVNIGAFYMLPTTYSEKYVGYWLAFTEAGAIYFLLPILLALVYKRTIRSPPSGNTTLKLAAKVIITALKRNKLRFWKKNFWDAARPEVLAQQGTTVDWSDKFVNDVRRTMEACEIFFFVVIWNMNDGGAGSILNNQGASMTTNGAPNDVLNNFNALTIIITVPLLTYVVYPTLRRFQIKFGRIDRMTCGFLIAAFSGVIGAIVQWRVYKTSPCGYLASTCDDVSPLSIWWQIPNVSLGAVSECFVQVTAYELAYARSPKEMRGLVTAFFLFQIGLSSALSEILLPAMVDPYLIYAWAVPAGVLFVQTIWFQWRFRHLNDDEFMTETQEREEISRTNSEHDKEKA